MSNGETKDVSETSQLFGRINIGKDSNPITLRFPDERDHILRTIRQTQTFYESDLLDATSQFLKAGDVVVDVGSNVGNHAVYWASKIQCQVFAFEPVPQIFDCLVQNIVSNQMERNIFPNRIALGMDQGYASIESYDPRNSGASRLVQRNDAGKIPVLALDALDFVKFQSVRLLKIDVEGMEFDVIKGALNLISRDTPIIICECPTNGEFEQISALLATSGYIPVECFNATATYLFVPKNEFENSGQKFREYIMSSLLRNSRFNHDLRDAMSQQRAMTRALIDKIDKITT